MRLRRVRSGECAGAAGCPCVSTRRRRLHEICTPCRGSVRLRHTEDRALKASIPSVRVTQLARRRNAHQDVSTDCQQLRILTSRIPVPESRPRPTSARLRAHGAVSGRATRALAEGADPTESHQFRTTSGTTDECAQPAVARACDAPYARRSEPPANRAFPRGDHPARCRRWSRRRNQVDDRRLEAPSRFVPRAWPWPSGFSRTRLESALQPGRARSTYGKSALRRLRCRGRSSAVRRVSRWRTAHHSTTHAAIDVVGAGDRRKTVPPQRRRHRRSSVHVSARVSIVASSTGRSSSEPLSVRTRRSVASPAADKPAGATGAWHLRFATFSRRRRSRPR